MKTRSGLSILGLVLSNLCPSSATSAPEAGLFSQTPNRLSKRSIGDRIIGGENADLENYKYIAYFKSVEDSSYRCTGQLIRPNVVLTAAHCLYESNTVDEIQWDNIQIGVGSVQPIPYNDNIYSVKNVIIHPKYVNEDPYRDDLALLFLDECVSPDVAEPIEIDTTPIDRTGTYTVSGFGYTSNENSTLSVLNELQVIQGRQDYCDRMLGSDNADGKVFCAGITTGKSVCLGDSGGPMTGLDYKKLVGIVSSIVSVNGKVCDSANTVAIYMMMSYYWDEFISQHVDGCSGPNCDDTQHPQVHHQHPQVHHHQQAPQPAQHHQQPAQHHQQPAQHHQQPAQHHQQPAQHHQQPAQHHQQPAQHHQQPAQHHQQPAQHHQQPAQHHQQPAQHHQQPAQHHQQPAQHHQQPAQHHQQPAQHHQQP
ncbi:Serine protease 30, partial [Zancudomyces culisetae]